jgi:peptide/nickel transport system substrate-binding protein
MDKEWVVQKGGWDGSCDTWQNFYAFTSENDPFTSIANGTGPYKLDHWTKGQEIVLVRNDDYWRTEPAWDGGPMGPAAIERVVIQNVTEFGTRFSMFQAGDADGLVVGSQADYAQVDPLVGEECQYNADTGGFDPCTPVGDGSGPIRVYKGYPQVVHSDVFFNFKISSDQYIGSGKLDGNGIPADFFDDIHIRKAFNYCFDWDTFIQDVMVGEGVQTLTIPVAGMPGFDANAPHYTYDPDKCAQEFKLADVDKDGIPAGDDTEGDVWTTGFRFSATYNQAILHAKAWRKSWPLIWPRSTRSS